MATAAATLVAAGAFGQVGQNLTNGGPGALTRLRSLIVPRLRRPPASPESVDRAALTDEILGMLMRDPALARSVHEALQESIGTPAPKYNVTVSGGSQIHKNVHIESARDVTI